MTNHSLIEALDDPVEAAFLASRRRLNTRIIGVMVLVVGMAVLVVGWKVGRHVAASKWLATNQHRVTWEINAANRKLGGATSVQLVQNVWGVGSNMGVSGDIKLLTWLHRVEDLDLTLLAKLSDKDLEILDQLPELRTLNLDKSRSVGFASLEQPGRVTDATLMRIKGLRNLEDVNLGNHRISDAGLANLVGLAKLKNVVLRFTPITDAGFLGLKTLPSLKSVDITGTNISDKAIQEFQAARPDVTVVDDTKPAPDLMNPAPLPRIKR